MIWALAILIGIYLLVSVGGEQGVGILSNTTPPTRIVQLAQAINQAENSGRDNSNHNPGNIRDTVTGNISSYPDIQTGWQRLYNKLDYDFVTGLSTVYSPNMTFRELGWMWVAGGKPGQVQPILGDNPDAWASIVSGYLGVDVTVRVGDFLNS